MIKNSSHSLWDFFVKNKLKSALYGDHKYWVRPEKMFFETIEREGKRFSRFTEIDWEE
jgi:hypothetical protein